MINKLLKSFILYFNTLKYLSLNQIILRLRNIIRLNFIKYFPNQYFSYIRKNLDYNVNKNFFFKTYHFKNNNDYRDLLNLRFNFLNQKYSFNQNIDWKDEVFFNNNILWKYNLNYHNFLLDIIDNDPSKEKIDFIEKIISSWIKDNDFSKHNFDNDNWNSYVISNRVLSWIKVYAYYKGSFSKNFEYIFIKSLRFQLEFLSKNIEYHLRGNHLLENAFALYCGAYFFNNRNLFNQSLDIILKELDCQILNDGAHNELSPMYHQHILTRILDCYQISKENNLFDKKLNNINWKEYISLMLDWIEKVTFDNDDLPLVNDCSEYIYPKTSEIAKYALYLGFQSKEKKDIVLNDSGYRKRENDLYEFFCDIGKMGPDYNPGHAHNDTFSFTMHISQKPFFVDTGTSTYNFSERRIKERSTSSHNTVLINSQEQSEIWGNFRVGKRINPKILLDESNIIEAQYQSVFNKSIHNRKFLFKENEVTIKDKVNKQYINESHLHFHPSVEINKKENIIETEFATIRLLEFDKILLEDYYYAESFNILRKGKKLRMFFKNTSSINIILK